MKITDSYSLSFFKKADLNQRREVTAIARHALFTNKIEALAVGISESVMDFSTSSVFDHQKGKIVAFSC